MKAQIRKDFIVYAYVREKDDQYAKAGTYYYIGKGVPKRPYMCGKRKVKCPKNRENNIIIMYKNLDEKTAFELEIKTIALFGRVDKSPGTGILLNMTDGGEGASGFKFREESREKKRGPRNPKYIPRDWSHPVHGFVGNKSCCDLIRDYPDENLNRACLSNLVKGKISYHKSWVYICDSEKNIGISEENLRNKYSNKYAIGVLEEAKERRRRNHFSSSHKGEMSPLYGKKLSPEHVLKISQTSKKNAKRKNFNWSHPDYGTFLNISVPELIEKFPDQKLDQGSLCKVANNKRKYHKGWVCLGVADKVM